MFFSVHVSLTCMACGRNRSGKSFQDVFTRIYVCTTTWQWSVLRLGEYSATRKFGPSSSEQMASRAISWHCFLDATPQYKWDQQIGQQVGPETSPGAPAHCRALGSPTGRRTCAQGAAPHNCHTPPQTIWPRCRVGLRVGTGPQAIGRVAGPNRGDLHQRRSGTSGPPTPLFGRPLRGLPPPP